MLRAIAVTSLVLTSLALVCQGAETSENSSQREVPGVQNPMEIWPSDQEIMIFSHTGITYRAIVDILHGGVISSLQVPGHGPNLVYNQHAPFRGFMNTFCMTLGKDEKTGKEKAIGRSTLWWLKNCAPVETKVIERKPESVIIESTGAKPGMGTGDACVVMYKLRYTFLNNRIVCENDVDWVYGRGTSLTEMSLLHYLQPRCCRYPAYAVGDGSQETELPITSSGGTRLPQGVEFPFTIRVPLNNGLSITFRLLEAPRAYRDSRWYIFERPWQCDWGQVVAFTGISKKEENAFEGGTVHTKHECIFSHEPVATQNPVVELLSPAGVEPAFRPGSHVTFEAVARQADQTPIPDAEVQWEFFLNWQGPGGHFSGGKVDFVIPKTDDKGKPVTLVWTRVGVTGNNGRAGHTYGMISVDEHTPYGVWGK